MSAKKRTTVTTIETHEVWVIRRPAPEPAGDAVMNTPSDPAEPTQPPHRPPGEPDCPAETDEEQGS